MMKFVERWIMHDTYLFDTHSSNFYFTEGYSERDTPFFFETQIDTANFCTIMSILSKRRLTLKFYFTIVPEFII